jgi:hypothetical protein
VGGWWSIWTSLLTPFILLWNTWQYVHGCLTLKPAPAGAEPPRLTPEAVDRLKPLADQLHACLQAGEEAEHLAYKIGPSAGVTPGQVMLFIWAMRRERHLYRSTKYIGELKR